MFLNHIPIYQCIYYNKQRWLNRPPRLLQPWIIYEEIEKFCLLNRPPRLLQRWIIYQIFLLPFEHTPQAFTMLDYLWRNHKEFRLLNRPPRLLQRWPPRLLQHWIIYEEILEQVAFRRLQKVST